MTDEHDYGGISHEEIVRTDSFQSMQVSIAALLESLCWQSGTCDQFGHMSAMRMLKMHSPQVNLIKT